MLAGTTGMRKLRPPNSVLASHSRAAFHAALARQQQDVVVIKNFHDETKLQEAVC
jgi:hypothetical protein